LVLSARDGRLHIEYVKGLSHHVYVKDLSHYYDDIQPDRLVDALMEGFEGKSFTPAERLPDAAYLLIEPPPEAEPVAV